VKQEEDDPSSPGLKEDSVRDGNVIDTNGVPDAEPESPTEEGEVRHPGGEEEAVPSDQYATLSPFNKSGSLRANDSWFNSPAYSDKRSSKRGART
jgi:hypothetical protein